MAQKMQETTLRNLLLKEPGRILPSEVNSPQQALDCLRKVNRLVEIELEPYAQNGELGSREVQARRWLRQLKLELTTGADEITIRTALSEAVWHGIREKTISLIRTGEEAIDELLDIRASKVQRSGGHPFTVATVTAVLILALGSLIRGLPESSSSAIAMWLHLALFVLVICHYVRVFSALTLLEHDPKFRFQVQNKGGRLLLAEYAFKICVLISLAVLAALIGGPKTPILWVLLWFHTVVLILYTPMLNQAQVNESISRSNAPVIWGNYGFAVVVFFFSLANAPPEFFTDPSSGELLKYLGVAAAILYCAYFALHEFYTCYFSGVKVLVNEIRCYLFPRSSAIGSTR